jgi:hypothetical protein
MDGTTRKAAMRIRALALVVTVASSVPALGLGVGLGLGLGTTLVGCKKKKPQPFTCERFQKRMERCERNIVAAAKRRFGADVKTGDIGPAEAGARVKKLQWRIRKRIRFKNSERRCRKLQSLQTPHHRKRFTTMKYCLGRTGCKAFGQCVLGLW